MLALLPELHFRIQIPWSHREILTAKPKQGLGVVLLKTSSGNSGTPGPKYHCFRSYQSDITKSLACLETMQNYEDVYVRRHKPSSKFHACTASTQSRLFLKAPFQAEPAGRKTLCQPRQRACKSHLPMAQKLCFSEEV